MFRHEDKGWIIPFVIYPSKRVELFETKTSSHSIHHVSTFTRLNQIKDVTRNNCKGVVATTLEEVKAKAAEKFAKVDVPNIHLDSDGTEVDDEDYFQTLEPNTELVAVFTGEQWIDVNINNVISTYCENKTRILAS